MLRLSHLSTQSRLGLFFPASSVPEPAGHRATSLSSVLQINVLFLFLNSSSTSLGRIRWGGAIRRRAQMMVSPFSPLHFHSACATSQTEMRQTVGLGRPTRIITLSSSSVLLSPCHRSHASRPIQGSVVTTADDFQSSAGQSPSPASLVVCRCGIR